MLVRRFLVLAGVFLSVLMASTSLVAAQSEPDVAAIGDAVSSADQATLISDLETPMKARELPSGFTDASYVDISTAAGAGSEDCMYDASTVGVTGAVGYLVTVDPDVVSYPYTCASINYLAFDEKDMGNDPLGDFKQGVESGLEESSTPAADGTPASDGGTVTDVTVAGEDAILLTYTLQQGGAYVVVQTLAIPVGNVFVVALVSVGDSAEVDAADVETLVNDLTVAAIDHLGTVAEGAQ